MNNILKFNKSIKNIQIKLGNLWKNFIKIHEKIRKIFKNKVRV